MAYLCYVVCCFFGVNISYLVLLYANFSLKLYWTSIVRNTVYDSSLGGCLDALHSGCADDVVKLTAADLVNVFPQSMRRTKSQELKVNFDVQSLFGKLSYSCELFICPV